MDKINGSTDTVIGHQQSELANEYSILKQKYNKIELINTHLLNVLHQIKASSTEIILQYENSNLNSTNVIDNLLVSDNTLKDYKNEWNTFENFANSNSMNHSLTETANQYLKEASKTCLPSTVNKKKNIIQNILRQTTKNGFIKLNTYKRVKVKKKYAMSKALLKRYLKEQKQNKNSTSYMIQYLLSKFACRINAVAGLCVHHLEFMKGNNNKIILPDRKTGEYEVNVPEKAKIKILAYLKRNKIETGFIFKAGKSENLTRRAHTMAKNINDAIKKSKVLPLTKNWCFSSHMFRRTLAQLKNNEIIEKAKVGTRKKIGQMEGSKAVGAYLD
jgi:integrase